MLFLGVSDAGGSDNFSFTPANHNPVSLSHISAHISNLLLGSGSIPVGWR